MNKPTEHMLSHAFDVSCYFSCVQSECVPNQKFRCCTFHITVLIVCICCLQPISMLFFLQFSFGQVFCILFCKLCCISFEHDFLFWGKERDSVSRLMYSDDDDYSSSCFNTIIFDPLPILSCNF